MSIDIFGARATFRSVFEMALETAGIPSIIESSGLDRGDSKRTEGVTLFPFARGRTLVWDPTCTDISSSSLIESAVNPGFDRAEVRKITKCASLSHR